MENQEGGWCRLAGGAEGVSVRPGARWARGMARHQTGRITGLGFVFCCFKAKQLLTFTGTKAFKEGPMAFTDAAWFLQQPSAPRMQCTARPGPAGHGTGGTPCSLFPPGASVSVPGPPISSGLPLLPWEEAPSTTLGPCSAQQAV